MKKRVLVLASILSLTMSVSAFAGPNHSFCVGAEMTTMNSHAGPIDTTQDAFNVAWNLSYAGYVPQLILSKASDEASKINVDTVTFDRLNSGVVYLAAHGSTDGKEVIWVNNNTDLNFKLVNNGNYATGHGLDVTKGNYSNTKLAIIGTCNCGVVGGVAQTFQQKGADCSIGWTGTVDNNTMTTYMKHLSKHLADGKTVSAAIKEANVSVLEELGENPDMSFKTYKTYGSGVYNSIKISSSAVTNLAVQNSMADEYSVDLAAEDIYDPDTYQRPTEKFTNIEDKNIEYRNGDDTEIASYFKNSVDSSFNEKLFEKTEIETIPGDDSDMILLYRFKVGNVVSNFGYIVNIEDYKVKGYEELGDSLYHLAVPNSNITDSAKEEKLKAYNNGLKETNDTVKEQTVDVLFDSVSKQFKYFVKTVYETETGGIYAVREEVQ